MRKLFAIYAALSLGAAAACTVHQDGAPSLSGPSTNAISLTISATPDTLPQNGTAQATVRIKAFNAGGQPLASLPVRLDLKLNGVNQDFGTLSVRNLVTGSDGTASAIYTAPAGPNAGGLGTTVAVVATPVAGDAVNQGVLNSVGAVSQAFVRLVSEGVTNPGSDTPTAAFTTAGTLTAGALVLFNGTTSTSGGTNSAVVDWDWDFGDGSPHGNGSVVTHSFATARPYAVVLTVTNSLGRSTSTTSVVTIGAGTGPLPLFTALPNPATVNSTVTLDGSPSTGSPINYTWTITSPAAAVTRFGGPDAKVTFSPTAVGNWNVNLTVTDTNGRSNTSAAQIVIVQ
jgi:PKD repeat protein